MDTTGRKAVVVEQWGLMRSGIQVVLEDLDCAVVGSVSRSAEGLSVARSESADLVVAGRAPDLKAVRALATLKALPAVPRVILLIDRAGGPEVAELISKGADGLLLRSVEADELGASIEKVLQGERVVASALAADTVGRVGPTGAPSVHLSPKEAEVLGELASGSSYDEIAASLVVTKATVKTHLVHIYDKLQVRNRHEAVAKGLALGLLG